MAATPFNATGEYQPESVIELPALYAWPPKPLAALKWLLFDMLFPWGYLYIGLSFLAWYLLMPAMTEMTSFEFSWIATIWLRNAAILTLVAGGLHWWFYIKRGQGSQYKYHDKWLEADSDKFLWRNQLRDNVFWSLISGVSICSAYEVMTFWIYANGYVALPVFVDHPLYLLLCIFGVFFWGTYHFYLVHRAMHWQPLYKISHEMHHRNVNTGPWTGISMHPIEHVIYFSVFPLLWVVPVHPAIIILMSLFMAVGPAPSHSGFNYLAIGGRRFFTGDWYHQLHHSFFNFNYGNTLAPLDAVFGSWHDGSRESLQRQKERKRQKRRSST